MSRLSAFPASDDGSLNMPNGSDLMEHFIQLVSQVNEHRHRHLRLPFRSQSPDHLGEPGSLRISSGHESPFHVGFFKIHFYAILVLSVQHKGFSITAPAHALPGLQPFLGVGSTPMRSLTAARIRCLEPRYRSVVWTKTCPSRNWSLQTRDQAGARRFWLSAGCFCGVASVSRCVAFVPPYHDQTKALHDCVRAVGEMSMNNCRDY